MIEYIYSQVMKVSSISNADTALITAHWMNIVEEEFQCNKVEEAYSNRNDAELAIKMRRIKHGCGILSSSVKVEVGYIGYHSCLCYKGYKHPLMSGILQLREAYEKGVLPFSGGILEQPAQVMEILSLINRLHSEYELAQSKKQLNREK